MSHLVILNRQPAEPQTILDCKKFRQDTKSPQYLSENGGLSLCTTPSHRTMLLLAPRASIHGIRRLEDGSGIGTI